MSTISGTKFLIFDTETTGLPKLNQYSDIATLVKNDTSTWSKYDIKNFPYVIQLTYMIYNTSTNQVDKIYNKYVDLPEDVKSKLKNEINIMRNSGDEKEKNGANILENNLKRAKEAKIEDKDNQCDLMEHFLKDVDSVDGIVAHNINFDLLMMIILGKRCGKTDEDLQSLYKNATTETIETIETTEKICTMQNGTQVCKIPNYKLVKDTETGELIKMTDSDGNPIVKKYKGKISYKQPKLIELYKSLPDFSLPPEKEELLHDSLYDVILTLRAFVQMEFGYDICNKRPESPNKPTKEVYKLLSKISGLGDPCYADENTKESAGGKRKTRKHKRKKNKHTKSKKAKKKKTKKNKRKNKKSKKRG